MDLETVRAAVNDIERQLKKIRNMIAYREKIIVDTNIELGVMKRSEEALTDRYVELVAEERRLKEQG